MEVHLYRVVLLDASQFCLQCRPCIILMDTNKNQTDQNLQDTIDKVALGVTDCTLP